jgi:DNA repair ATPase RecN
MSLKNQLTQFTSHLELFNNQSETVLNNYDTQMSDMANLLKSYQPLISQTQSLLNTIDKIDFPNRLNQLDTSIFNINEGVKTVQNDVNELLASIEDEEKSTNFLKIVIFLLSALSIGGIIWLLI